MYKATYMEKIKNYGRKVVKVICDNCGCEFEKPQSEFTRNIKLGRKNYCSRKCAGEATAKRQTGKKRKLTEKLLEHLQEICDNKRDEYTPYRYTYGCVKKRFKEVDIEIEDLVEQWEKQDGICPYTGFKLVLPEYGNLKDIDFFHRASLDRIDSTKGYVRGNIQFVSTPINLMKQSQSDESIRKFLKDISDFTSKL